MNAKKEAPVESDLFTTHQASQYLNISRPTLYSWARRARIRRVKVGRVVRWPKEELDRMKEGAMRQLR